jgi:hypothetical protein
MDEGDTQPMDDDFVYVPPVPQVKHKRSEDYARAISDKLAQADVCSSDHVLILTPLIESIIQTWILDIKQNPREFPGEFEQELIEKGPGFILLDQNGKKRSCNQIVNFFLSSLRLTGGKKTRRNKRSYKRNKRNKRKGSRRSKSKKRSRRNTPW